MYFLIYYIHETMNAEMCKILLLFNNRNVQVMDYFFKKHFQLNCDISFQ